MQTRATFRRGLILVAGALLVAGSPLGTTGGLGASQDKGTEEALKAIRAELQKRCAKEEDLRGVLVVRVGPSRMLDRCALLCLVDDPKQAKLLKTRADAAVAANPDWKKRYPLGVEVQETVFPLRSQYVKEFQKAFATTDWATKEEQGVLPRTRLDDAYYNADGHLTLVGVWVANPTAPSADPDKAMAVINKAVGDLLGKLEDKYKIPNDREGFKIRLLESHEGFRLLPAGVAGLQTRVVAQPGLEEVLFQDASYDAAGTLHLKGLVGGEDKKKAIHRFIEGLAADSSWKERVMLQPQAGGRDNTWSLDRLTVIDWRVGKEPLQAACAASSNLVLRRVRIDRAYYRYPGQGTPHLVLEGVCCDDRVRTDEQVKGALETALKELYEEAARGPLLQHLGGKLALRLDPTKVIEGVIRPPLEELQNKIATTHALDGICVWRSPARKEDLFALPIGGHFDGQGRYCLQGVWRGEEQKGPLETAVKGVFKKQAERLLQGKLCFDGLTKVDTTKLLRDLQTWVKSNLEEVSVESLYFDAEGKLTFKGTRPEGFSPGALPWLEGALPPEEAAVWDRLRRLISVHPDRKLLEWTPPAKEVPTPEAKKAALVVLMSVALLGDPPAVGGPLQVRKSLTRELRKRVQGRAGAPWAGVLIERGYYDEEGRYGIKGLVDRAEQNALLNDLLKEISREEEWQKHLDKRWLPPQLTELPLEGMLRELRDVMPEYADLDGIRFVSAYHDVENRLVLAGYEVKGIRGAGAGGKVKELLAEDEKWKRRVAAGTHLALEELERKVNVAELAVQRTAELLRKSLPDSLNAVCTTEVPALIPPYKKEGRWFLGSIPAEVVSASMEYLNTALMHNPVDDTAAWFLRAMNHMSRGERVLAARDLRRMAILEADRPYLREARLVKLEALQGALRIVVTDFADHITIEAGAGRVPLRLIDVREPSVKLKIMTARR